MHNGGASDVYLLEEVREDAVTLRPSDAIRANLAAVRQPVVLCGHGHVPRAVSVPTGPLVVNPGSVGLPAYTADAPRPHAMEAGTPHARYAILSRAGDAWGVMHIAVPYPWDVAATTARANGRPEWARWLTAGRAPLTTAPGLRGTWSSSPSLPCHVPRRRTRPLRASTMVMLSMLSCPTTHEDPLGALIDGHPGIRGANRDRMHDGAPGVDGADRAIGAVVHEGAVGEVGFPASRRPGVRAAGGGRVDRRRAAGCAARPAVVLVLSLVLGHPAVALMGWWAGVFGLVYVEIQAIAQEYGGRAASAFPVHIGPWRLSADVDRYPGVLIGGALIILGVALGLLGAAPLLLRLRARSSVITRASLLCVSGLACVALLLVGGGAILLRAIAGSVVR